MRQENKVSSIRAKASFASVYAAFEVKDADERRTIGSILTRMGRSSHVMILLILTILNMIPGPPGFGATLAITMLLVACFFLLRLPIGLPKIVLNIEVNDTIAGRFVALLTRLDGYISAVARPRFRFLTRGVPLFCAMILLAFTTFFMMPPIPLINAVPNVGLFVMIASIIKQDGIGMLLGIFISAVGIIIAIASIYGVITLIKMAIVTAV